MASDRLVVVEDASLGARRSALRLGRLADVVGPLAVVAVAVPMRLVNIGSYSGKADEGIRAEQLLLMAHGFRPVKEVFASQGPLSLDVFYPFFVALGETLAGARLAVVVYSTLAILAAYWVATLIGGRPGGWAAAVLLLLSPTFLTSSRLALVELPAMLPATLALAAALCYQRDGRRRWLVGSAVALGLALCVKPMMMPVVPAVGLALLLRRGIRLADAALYAATFVGLLVAVIGLVGPTELYDQVVRYRVGSRQAEGWSLWANWSMLRSELQSDGLPFFGLAGTGALVLLAGRPRLGLPAIVWAVATIVVLLFYSPLGTKHAALQPLPTAILGGAGLGLAWRVLLGGARQRQAPTWQLRAAGVACGVVVLAYVATLPSVIAADRQSMAEGDAGRERPYPEESALIQALTTPSDYILVDDPYLAYLNRRLMPPQLVDTSIFRIRSGALSGADVVEHAEAFDVRVMLLLSDNLRELKKFRDWTDERFLVVKITERSNRKDRAVYLRDDADLEQARDTLRRLTPVSSLDAELAGQVRARGAVLDRAELRAGGSANLTVEWEAVAPIQVDWHPITFLRDREGKLVDQAERSLGGGGGGTSSWQPGRWVFRTSTLTIPPRTPAGEYRLSIGLYDSKARRMAEVSGGAGVGREEIDVATLRVR